MDAHGLEPREKVSASKKLSRRDAEELASAASKLIVAKGKKVTTFSPRKEMSEELVLAMLGPTGNLRAPLLVAGKTVLVGFNEEAFEENLL